MRKTLLGLILLAPLSVIAGDRYTIDISVRGMMCEFCAQKVESVLTGLKGVTSAKVDLDEEIAHIECASKQAVDLEKIRQALTDAGFSAGKVIATRKDSDA